MQISYLNHCKATISAAEGEQIAEITLTFLQKMKNSEEYDLFWSSALKQISSIDVAEPVLPRHRKRPRRYQTGSKELTHPLRRTISRGNILKVLIIPLMVLNQGSISLVMLTIARSTVYW